jgi:hypothetical protein
VEVRPARTRLRLSQVLPLSQSARLLDLPDDKDADKDHPHFGDVAEIYNVIDARQSEAQNTVIEALRGLGHNEAADHYTHFSYEMVALTPRCAAELGYTLSEEDKTRSYIEVSGRKGFGVKADDLLDQLIAPQRARLTPAIPSSPTPSASPSPGKSPSAHCATSC